MRDYLARQIKEALETMGDVPAGFEPEFQQPANPDHGDLSTNVALQLARPLKRAPRQVAEDLVARLRFDPRRITSAEIAGPGFINFRFSEHFLSDALTDILRQGDRYGRTATGAGRRVLVEFVSANPTGPLTVGHGRNAVLGDTISNLYSWTGWDVTREYYFNDAGRQMRILGQSVQARYVALADPSHGTKMIDGAGEPVEVPESFPEDGYLGDYIGTIATGLFEKHGNSLLGSDDPQPFKEAAETAIFTEIKATLVRLGIRMDTYFNERTLYESGQIWQIVDDLKARNLAYEKDGAVWFRTTGFGKETDTVLVKSTGEPTYRLPDIGYHVEKLGRGFDCVVDVFGADHIATFPDVVAGVKALGHDSERIQVLIYQFVTLVRGGEPVKMSTRKATYVTLDELMDEVSEDVTRFFFLMRSPNTHLEFDLDLAKEASEKNPVFYLQYAHARICSILRKAEEVGFSFDAEGDLTLLTHEVESSLIKVLLSFPDTLDRAAEAHEPHRVATYLREVAVAFTQFYGACRIIGEDPAVAGARMRLALAARRVLRNGLTVLGLSAPERM